MTVVLSADAFVPIDAVEVLGIRERDAPAAELNDDLHHDLPAGPRLELGAGVDPELAKERGTTEERIAVVLGDRDAEASDIAYQVVNDFLRGLVPKIGDITLKQSCECFTVLSSRFTLRHGPLIFNELSI